MRRIPALHASKHVTDVQAALQPQVCAACRPTEPEGSNLGLEKSTPNHIESFVLLSLKCAFQTRTTSSCDTDEGVAAHQLPISSPSAHLSPTPSPVHTSVQVVHFLSMRATGRPAPHVPPRSPRSRTPHCVCMHTRKVPLQTSPTREDAFPPRYECERYQMNCKLSKRHVKRQVRHDRPSCDRLLAPADQYGERKSNVVVACNC